MEYLRNAHDDIDQEWVNGANCETAADGFVIHRRIIWPIVELPVRTNRSAWRHIFQRRGFVYVVIPNDACTDKFSEQQAPCMPIYSGQEIICSISEPVYVTFTETPALITPGGCSH